MTGTVNPATSVHAFILGAGRSTRMGRPKLLLPWAGTNVVGHLLKQWRAAGAQQIFLVLAQNDEVLARELDRAGLPKSSWILNPAPEATMFDSIRCAARASAKLPTGTHCAVVLGDQPHLRLSTLRALIGFAALNPSQICQPVYQGRARHPVLLPRGIFDSLADSPVSTLAEALTAYEIALCACDDPGLALDIDTPRDYQRALALWDEGKNGGV